MCEPAYPECMGYDPVICAAQLRVAMTACKLCENRGEFLWAQWGLNVYTSTPYVQGNVQPEHGGAYLSAHKASTLHLGLSVALRSSGAGPSAAESTSSVLLLPSNMEKGWITNFSCSTCTSQTRIFGKLQRACPIGIPGRQLKGAEHLLTT